MNDDIVLCNLRTCSTAAITGLCAESIVLSPELILKLRKPFTISQTFGGFPSDFQQTPGVKFYYCLIISMHAAGVVPQILGSVTSAYWSLLKTATKCCLGKDFTCYCVV